MNDLKSMELDMAHRYAMTCSGCTKVKVGSIIAKDRRIISCGANRTIPRLCDSLRGCLRVEKYGDKSKEHRNPADCRAIHSEVDAICNAAKNGISTDGAVIYVTRYPCEACARVIVSAGIKTVVYGRKESISDETRKIFESNHVECYHFADWNAEDDNS